MLSNDKLRHLRIIKGLTQADIADICGVSTRFVKMIEANQAVPQPEVYDKWLQAIYGNLKSNRKPKRRKV